MEDEVEGASICPNFICCTPFQERAFTRALMRRDISTHQEEAMYNIMSQSQVQKAMEYYNLLKAYWDLISHCHVLLNPALGL